MSLEAIRDLHRGSDIYVLGSGATLLHIPAAFFDGKIVVSTNHGCTKHGITPTYLVTKYHQHAQEYAEWFPQIPTLVTLHNRGNLWESEIPEGPWTRLPHDQNQDGHWAGNLPDDDKILVTYSTITTAMHVAAAMGARNIILAGHDCGWLDDAGRVPGYEPPSDDSWMWPAFNLQSVMAKARLVEKYGCTMTSVNPFINFHLEGHTFRGPR